MFSWDSYFFVVDPRQVLIQQLLGILADPGKQYQKSRRYKHGAEVASSPQHSRNLQKNTIERNGEESQENIYGRPEQSYLTDGIESTTDQEARQRPRTSVPNWSSVSMRRRRKLHWMNERHRPLSSVSDSAAPNPQFQDPLNQELEFKYCCMTLASNLGFGCCCTE